MSKYSEDTFRSLVWTLAMSVQITQENKTQIVEMIRAITEGLIWSEQNNLNFFTIFEEENTLEVYSHLLSKEFEKCITIQLLQSANLLIHNLKAEASKEFLLRSQFYREVLSHPFDFTDDEIIENYMSMLKGLAVNLTTSQLRQYLIDNHFTLFTGAMMFFNYHESLIKTASRTVVLHVLGGIFYIVNDEVIEKFILESGFFYNLVSNLKESIINIARSIESTKSLAKLESVVGESLDLLYHFNDIFAQGREIFSARLVDILLKALILPILLGSIIEEKHKPHHLSMPISLYMISHILYILKYPPLTNTLIEIIFSQDLADSYYQVVINSPNRESPPLVRSEETLPNPVNSIILAFLKCKEDNLAALSLSLLQAAFGNSVESFIMHPILQDPRIKYQELMKTLSGVIFAENEFRFFTCFLSCRLIYELSSIKSQVSDSGIESEIIRTALAKKVRSIESMLNIPYNAMNITKKFEEEWEFIRNLSWVDKLELPLNYILPSLDEMSSHIPLENRRNFTDEDSLRYEIRLFLLYRKLKFLLIPSEIPEGLDIEEYPLKSLSTCALMPNETYQKNTGLLKGRSTTRVIQKGLVSQTKYVIEDPHFFILSSMSHDNSSFFIEISVRFSRIYIQERPEPNIMVILVENQNPLVLGFEEFTEWIKVKNKFEKKAKECKDSDIRLLTSFIQENR